jgi:peptide/nickel transport system ATP-binding protein
MPLLQIQDLTTHFFMKQGTVRALDRVSLILNAKHVLGVAGESGCGKSTMAYSIMRLIPPPGKIVEGKIWYEDSDILRLSDEQVRKDIRWKKISMVFQGAMNALNPLITIGDQIAEPIIVHKGLDERKALEKASNLLGSVGIDSTRVNNYPFELSGGMKQRVMIAMAMACDPEIIIADEPTTALDVIVAAGIMNLIKDLQKRTGLSMILITHDLSVIAQTCHEVVIMYAGKIVESGDVLSVFENASHPYTRELIAAFPSIRGAKRELKAIKGSPPDLIDPPSGCRFNPRCRFAKEICTRQEPEFKEVGKDHFAACHLL